MRLDCLGSGFAFSHGRYWNGFLLDGRVLLDCPPQALVHLYRLGRTLNDLDAVLLSHEHFDHIGGMDPLLLEMTHGPGRSPDHPLAVVAPPGLRERLQELVGRDSSRLPPPGDPRLRWLEVRDGDALDIAGYRADVVEMEHASDLVAVGYRLTDGARTLAYTGDTRWTEPVRRLARHADLLVVECGEGGGAAHFQWPDIFDLRKTLPASTRVLVTHYDPRTAPASPLPEGLALAEDFAAYEV